jgi:drug/metabolite transporter (DMT)-like permease
MDLRTPIGLLFTLFGIALIAVGSTQPGLVRLGVNVDLVWGVVLLIFGLAMLALAYSAGKRSGSKPPL